MERKRDAYENFRPEPIFILFFNLINIKKKKRKKEKKERKNKQCSFTFSWLEPVLTLALDIRIAKSGSNLAYSHLSHILCLTPCVKARKSFHGVLPCIVMMYHQTNFDCKTFRVSEDLVETTVAFTLNIAKWFFWMILWLMLMHHHTKFDRSEILSRRTFTEVHGENTVQQQLKTSIPELC